MEDSDFSIELLEALPALRKQASKFRGYEEDDLVQQTCLLAWVNRDKLKGETARWASVILRNLARTQHARRPPVHVSLDDAVDGLSGIMEMSAEQMRNAGYILKATSSKPSQDYHISLLELIDHINTLPPCCQTSIVKHAVEGWSYEEIGKEMNWEPETVMSNVYYSRNRLRELA